MHGRGGASPSTCFGCFFLPHSLTSAVFLRTRTVSPPDTDSDFDGWPEDEGEYPVDHVTEEHREVMAERCSFAEAPDMPNLPSVPKDTETTSPVEDQDSDGEWEPPTMGSKEEEEVEEVEEEDVEESLGRYVHTSIQSVLAFVPFLTASSNVRAPLSRASFATTFSVHDDFAEPKKKVTAAKMNTKERTSTDFAAAESQVQSRQCAAAKKREGASKPLTLSNSNTKSGSYPLSPSKIGGNARLPLPQPNYRMEQVAVQNRKKRHYEEKLETLDEEIAKEREAIVNSGNDPDNIDMTASAIKPLARELGCYEETAAASYNTNKLRANPNVVEEGSAHALPFQDELIDSYRAAQISRDAARKGRKANGAGYRMSTANHSASARANIAAGNGFGKRNRDRSMNLRVNVRELVGMHPAIFSIHDDDRGFTITENGVETPDQHLNILIEKIRPAAYNEAQLEIQEGQDKKMKALKTQVMCSIRTTTVGGGFTNERFIVEDGKSVKLTCGNRDKRRLAASYVYRTNDTTGAPFFA